MISKIFSPLLIRTIHVLWHRSRHFRTYTLIGLISIIIEIYLRKYFINYLDAFAGTILSVFIGIIFAFCLNIYLNFTITKIRRVKAFLFFVMISLTSGIVQYIFYKIYNSSGDNYESSRFFFSGSVFLIIYFLHKRFTFKDYKKIGVAIYANGTENLRKISSKIGLYPNFIHVDIVDSSFLKNAESVKAYRMETVRALWPEHEIHTHIMSRYPSKWINEIVDYCDIIFIHIEINEDIAELLNIIKKSGTKPGIAVTMETDISKIESVLIDFEYLLLLTIENPGYSGQDFHPKAQEFISQINKFKNRKDFRLCIDGGVKLSNSVSIDAEYLVSGSTVLNNEDPKLQILKLQNRRVA